MKSLLTVREATPEDVQGIYELLVIYSRKQVVLERPHEDILKNIDNFVIASFDGNIRGCCAVRDFGNNLLEVRSLVVSPELQSKGVGRAMVEAIMAGLKLKRKQFCLFALTYRKDFFHKLGFHDVLKEMFPQKIWSDCSKCPKKDHCDEDAVMIEYGY
ncbi:GNAT family N-acetyltransferase [Lentisphaerota bacterium ZTH]|nr:GNAT family N-acetyltransferase [Lentisphaerota bacterium]WET06920.1 GNAT family N-acetyltransferase [Lentisphaerota bacterium ZTH]